jgi:hypothetical protein
MPDLTAITAALTSLKAAKDIAEAMVGIRDNVAFQTRLVEFQSKLIEANSAALAVQEERSALLDRIRELEKELGELKSLKAEMTRYRLEMLPPGKYVRALKPDEVNEDPLHYACDVCFRRDRISILHNDEPNYGIYHLQCFECGNKWEVGHFNPPSKTRDVGWVV